jgi:hypothetical protein
MSHVKHVSQLSISRGIHQPSRPWSSALTTIPNSTAALVALRASITRSLFSPTSKSLPPPT